MIHELKTEQKYFEEVAAGRKTFEIRLNDRDFRTGDFLALNEITEKGYTGRCCLFKVTYILRGFLPATWNYVVLGIRPCVISDRTVSTIFEHEDVYKAPIYEWDIPNENKIKTIWLAVFLNTAPTASNPKWCLVGDAKRDALYNPRTGELSFTYDNNSGKYSASIATPMTAIAGDEVFGFVGAAKIPRETQCLLVYLKIKPKAGVYKAERCDCTVKRIAYRECGTSADFTITLLDAAKRGIFNAVAKQFTPN